MGVPSELSLGFFTSRRAPCSGTQVVTMGYSDFLFAQPGFLEGMARVVDTAGALNQYNRMPSSQEADALAMWADWAAVGAEIAAAAAQFNGRVRLELKSVEK